MKKNIKKQVPESKDVPENEYFTEWDYYNQTWNK